MPSRRPTGRKPTTLPRAAPSASNGKFPVRPADRAIGVFDSGIGGLTVLRALVEELPNEDFIYLGDTARLPYGTKTDEVIIRYSRENTEFLLAKGIKMLVVACNTSSAVALEAIARDTTIPVIGVIEPGARAVVKASRCWSSQARFFRFSSMRGWMPGKSCFASVFACATSAVVLVRAALFAR